jgi:RNA polymerase sigma-70 factor (ECF subfamily)
MSGATAIEKTRELVTLAKQGNKTAAEKLFSVYGDRVRRIVRLRMGKQLRQRMESTDLVQEVLLSAWRDMDNFELRSDGDLLRWLAKITERRINDNFRKIYADKRDARREVQYAGSSKTLSSDGIGPLPKAMQTTTPSVLVARSEDLDRLERAMTELKPEYRQVILLTKIDGLSYGQAGKELKRSPDAVRMLLSRAMSELATEFEHTQ